MQSFLESIGAKIVNGTIIIKGPERSVLDKFRNQLERLYRSGVLSDIYSISDKIPDSAGAWFSAQAEDYSFQVRKGHEEDLFELMDLARKAGMEINKYPEIVEHGRFVVTTHHKDHRYALNAFSRLTAEKLLATDALSLYLFGSAGVTNQNVSFFERYGGLGTVRFSTHFAFFGQDRLEDAKPGILDKVCALAESVCGTGIRMTMDFREGKAPQLRNSRNPEIRKAPCFIVDIATDDPHLKYRLNDIALGSVHKSFQLAAAKS